jgi:rare lipoprotein A
MNRVFTSAFALAVSMAVVAPVSFAQAPAAAPVAPATAPVTTPAAAAAPAPAATKPAAVASGDGMDGKIAYYGGKFNGRKTASGERFSSAAMTMAHKTLAFGTLVRVTNVKTKKSVVVRVNDRGPSTPDRIGDLTTAAAKKIGIIKAGTGEVKLTIVGKKGKASKVAKANKTKAKKAMKK